MGVMQDDLTRKSSLAHVADCRALEVCKAGRSAQTMKVDREFLRDRIFRNNVVDLHYSSTRTFMHLHDAALFEQLVRIDSFAASLDRFALICGQRVEGEAR